MQAVQETPPLHEEANGVALEAPQDAAEKRSRFGVRGAGDHAIFRGAAAWAAREILARVMLHLPGTAGQRSAARANESRGVGSSALAPPALGGGGCETRSAGAAGGGGTAGPAGPPAFLKELAAKLNAEFWLDRNMSHLSPILVFCRPGGNPGANG